MPINNFLLPGAKVTTVYDVANSCRFNEPDDALMHKAITTPTDVSKMTFSCWVKRSGLAIGSAQAILSCDTPASTHYAKLSFEDDDTLRFILQNSSGSYDYNLITSAVFRDPSAWMNIVVLYNSDDGTSGDRVKIFVNGTRVTAFGTASYPSSAQDNGFLESSQTINVGGMYNSSAVSQHCDLYLAEVVFLDGVTKAATDFGEFDEDSPTIWKPKDVSGLSGEKGANGFYLDFEDSSNLGNDVFGGTDLTEVNLSATDSATDTCTNNFATINPLFYSASSYTLTEGNLSVDGNASSAWRSLYTTIPLTSGLWYWEVKIDAHNSTDLNNFIIGIVSIDQLDQTSSNGKFFGTAQGYGYHAKDGKKLNNDTVTANGASYGASFSTGNIIGVFLDLDNHKLYFSKDGVVQASGDPTSGSSGTNAAFSITTGHTYVPCIANYYTQEQYTFNFGNPVVALSSAQNDPNGYGSFEHSTEGYYSICTKNLAEFG